MTPTATAIGRLWLMLPGCRIYPGDDCPDPSLAVAHTYEGSPSWVAGPPCADPPRPAAKAARRAKVSTGGMFDAKAGSA